MTECQHITEDDRNMALLNAAAKGHHECVDKLIEAGADVNAADFTGLTALMCATQNGQSRCGEMLIKLGADVNQADHPGNTALLLEVDKKDGHDECVALLND